MGQKKGTKSKKTAVATAGEKSTRSKAEVTALRPEEKAKKTSVKNTSKTEVGPSHDQIAQRAHELWLQDGAKHGDDQRYWLEAETQLNAEMAAK